MPTNAYSSGKFSVGLTGGIGCGKTTVADMFAAHGVAVIDTDQIAHQLTASAGLAIPAINTQFGKEFLTPDGALDRSKMRELVFADATAKQRLEAILHPLIRTETERAAAMAQGTYLMFVVPLLVESGNWKQRVSRVLVIDCPEELQLKRVMQRSALTEVQVRAIMSTQVSRAARLAAADDVIVNDRDTASIVPEVDRLHALYAAMANNGKHR